jgi:hypothetical protein
MFATCKVTRTAITILPLGVTLPIPAGRGERL